MAHIPTEDRRRQFIEAAIRVIRRDGIARATTRKIAEEAGAPLATLHYCFGTKEELFEAVSHTFGDLGLSSATRNVRPQMGLAEAAIEILRTTTEYIAANMTAELTEFEFYAWALRSERHRDMTRRIYDKWIGGIARVLELGRRPDESGHDVQAIARMIVSCLDGYGLQDLMLHEEQLKPAAELAGRVLAAAISAGTFRPAG